MRPRYRRVLERDRLLKVFFYTSNIQKLAQARLIFSRHAYPLSHFATSREPYEEDYSGGTHQLLSNAIAEISGRFGIRSCFFVEDTSLRIEALSSESDFPGVAVKEWFNEISFNELDAQLNATGNNRRAIVKSDIGLHIPGLEQPIFFHGETHGTIAATPPTFRPNPVYPWLTPETFNGWFIPDGASKRLGEMEVEESLGFDFRSKSLMLLVERLSEYGAVANLSQAHFVTRRLNNTRHPELPLLAGRRRVIVFIGPSCAGKTTAGDILNREFGCLVIEASSMLRDIAQEHGETVTSGEEAFAFLCHHGKAIVAETIADFVEQSPDDLVVVTGFRTIEEIDCFSQRISNLLIVHVNAEIKIRFLRHVARARDKDPRTLRAFSAKDEEQAAFGLLRVADEVADITITNEGDLTSFERAVISTATYNSDIKAGSTARRTSRTSQNSELIRCLTALYEINRAATCREISDKTAESGSPVRVYNTNRALKAVPELAQRLEGRGQLVRYKIRPEGIMLLHLLTRRRRLDALAE